MIKTPRDVPGDASPTAGEEAPQVEIEAVEGLPPSNQRVAHPAAPPDHRVDEAQRHRPKYTMTLDPRPRWMRKISDRQLKAALDEGLGVDDIAERHGMSTVAVRNRITKLKLGGASAETLPEVAQARAVEAVDIMRQIKKNLEKTNKLLDACDEFLTDPEDAQKYLLSPRADEIDVVYEVEVPTERGVRIEKRVRPLRELLGKIVGARDRDGCAIMGEAKGEAKVADPRELILKAMAEARHTAKLFADLMQRLSDVDTLEKWRWTVVQEIAKESPEVAERIVDRLQRTLVLWSAFQPGTGLPAGLQWRDDT